MTATAIRTGWRSDRPFFMAMFAILAAIIVSGFGISGADFHFRYGRLPVVLQVHAAVFSSWVVFLLVQNALVVRGSIALHRTLGWIGAAIAAVMVVMGVAATLYVETHHQVPTFFPYSIFLVMNLVGISVFGALTWAAIARRRQPDWHKRLMYCATLVILGAALGRLLPMDAFGDAAPLVLFACVLVLLGVGMAYDRVTRQRIHAAYYWGGGAIVGFYLSIPLLAFSPPVQAIAAALKARGHV